MSVLGDALDVMMQTLKNRKSASMSDTNRYLAERLAVSTETLYKWRADVRPTNVMIERLVDIGVIDAQMDFAWANSVLTSSSHPDIYDILTRLFSTSQLPVHHNLPTKPYQRLVGRTRELEILKERLDPGVRQSVIAIEGIGGIGKTALALEAGWDAVRDSLTMPVGRRFEAIVWTTAKKRTLLTRGIVAQRPMLTNLAELYHSMGEVLEDQDVLKHSNTNAVLAALRRKGRVLLILDNLEDIDNLEILSFLREVPPPHKVIVTLRYHEDLPAPIRLQALDDDSMRDLINQELDERELILNVDQVTSVVRLARGLPLAATRSAGLIDRFGMPENVHGSPESLKPLLLEDADLVAFMFKDADTQLSKSHPDARRAWLALSFFDVDAGATLAAIAFVVGLDQEKTRQEMHRLYLLNLVTRTTPYTMLGFTHDMCMIQVLKEPWGPALRKRWLEWHSNLARKFAAEYLENEPATLDEINREWPNYRRAFDWCITHIEDDDAAYECLKEWWLASPIAPITICADVRGHWDDSVACLRCLVRESERREEPKVTNEARAALGRVLALKGQFAEATRELAAVERAGGKLDDALRYRVALNQAMLWLRRHDFDESTPLAEVHSLFDGVLKPLRHDAPLDPVVREHLIQDYVCYEAKLSYAEGHLDHSKHQFGDIAREYPAKRTGAYAHNYLADIALKQKALAAADEHIAAGLGIAERYHDVHRKALLLRLLAQLKQRQHEIPAAQEFASQAANDLSAIGAPEAKETRELAGTLSV